MSSPLSAIPVARRRHLAATLGLLAMLALAVGLVGATGRAPVLVRVFSAVAITVSVLLALVGWGVAHSVAADLAEARLDASLAVAVGGGGCGCGCGHEHDPTEMHVTGAPPAVAVCSHDGGGQDCAHDCEQCVLAALRPAPAHSRGERSGRLGE